MIYSSRRDQEALVVNLDGTLIRSEMKFEEFFGGGAAVNWARIFGRLPARAADLDVALLPYNEEVVAFIRGWRADGGRTILVAATDQALTEQIAAHLGVFDEVYGSAEKIRLEGSQKAAFLTGHFGDRGYTYMGHAAEDLPVWEKSSRAITVDAPATVRTRVAAMDLEASHLKTERRSSALSYLKALRPHQWLKNALVFVPMLAAHQITADSFWQAFLAFIIFSLVASSVYILNDLLDLASDRAHPRKRNRPFAAGIVPIAHGTWLAPLLLFAGLVIAFPLGRHFILVMLAYWVATTIYSLYIKQKIIIDIVTLAGLYTLRIVAGGVATGIPLSVWLLAFAIFIFFALASVKRQAELVDSVAADALQIQGRGYEAGDQPLVANMAIASGYVSVLVLALYVNSPDVLELYRNPAALWGICLVLLYWISRLVMVTHRGAMHDDPLVYAVTDPVSQVCFLIVLAFVIGGTLI